MSAPTVSLFLTAMRSYLGVIEDPYGSNRTRVGVEFGWNGVPWCAETISVAARKSGFGQLFWSASTDVWEANARRGVNNAKWISSGITPRPGDVAVWDYKRDGTANHVSVVESVRSDGKLITIGGNESNRCQRAVRSKYGLRGYVRMPFRVAVSPLPTPDPTPTPPVVAPKPPVTPIEEIDMGKESFVATNSNNHHWFFEPGRRSKIASEDLDNFIKVFPYVGKISDSTFNAIGLGRQKYQ